MMLSWAVLPILILFIGMAPVASTQQSQVIQQVEYLDASGEHKHEDERDYVINTNGRWNAGRHVLISVSGESDVSPETIAAGMNAVSGNFTAGYHGQSWTDLLSSLPLSQAPVLVPVQEKEVDIKLMLTNSEHPEGKIGKTRIYVVKDVREILFAEVEIYAADNAFRQGILDQVIIHELGHTLGLSHSTDPESIMFYLLEIDNGVVINNIGSCEEHALSSLYVQSKTGPVAC